MQYFNFDRLIEKYKTSLTVQVPSDGYYDTNGTWVKGGVTETVLNGAIVGLSESKVYRSSGTLTAKDKNLFLREPIDKALIGAEVIYKGSKYSINSEEENADFTGVYAYVLKYVSSFDEVANDD